MNTILITNSKNKFGEIMINRLKNKHNILVASCLHRSTDSKDPIMDTVNNVEYLNTRLLQSVNCYNSILVYDLIKQTHNLIDRTNQLYSGIDICIDCSENEKNFISALILNQCLAMNALRHGRKIKLIYNNSEVMSHYFQNYYPDTVSVHNCKGRADVAIAAIYNNFKFSTGSDEPYFEYWLK